MFRLDGSITQNEPPLLWNGNWGIVGHFDRLCFWLNRDELHLVDADQMACGFGNRIARAMGLEDAEEYREDEEGDRDKGAHPGPPSLTATLRIGASPPDLQCRERSLEPVLGKDRGLGQRRRRSREWRARA